MSDPTVPTTDEVVTDETAAGETPATPPPKKKKKKKRLSLDIDEVDTAEVLERKISA